MAGSFQSFDYWMFQNADIPGGGAESVLVVVQSRSLSLTKIQMSVMIHVVTGAAQGLEQPSNKECVLKAYVFLHVCLCIGIQGMFLSCPRFGRAFARQPG